MSFDTNAFDVNTVPLSAVKRVEVLLDSPSIAIGADAVGGVINIVLKDDIPAPLVEARYGTAAGGAAERRASLGLGTSREVFRGAVTLDVFDRDFLLGSERDLTRNQDIRHFSGRDARSPIASPANISSLTGTNLPGLSYSFAAVPLGSTGVGLTPTDFLATAGQRNLTSLNRYRSIIPATTRASVIASGEISSREDVVGFAELFATYRHNEFQRTLPMLGNAVVPSSNPHNPFGVPVVASALLQGIGPTTLLVDTTLVRGVLGARTKWHQWESEIGATWHQEDARHWREHELDPQRIAEALTSSDAASALNLFVDGPAGQPELLDSLQAPRRTLSYGSNTAQAYVRTQGPIATLPAGEVMITVGSEWRREGLSTLELSTLHRETSSAFAEVRIPLVSAEMDWPALDYLEFSSGIRGDASGDLGTTLSAQYGLVWRPAPHLKMRASYSDAYRPPTLYDLHSPRFTAPPFRLPDPRRNNELASFVVLGGGNPDLVPTFGQSWTVGLEFTPSERLRASAGYWHTKIMDRIVPSAIPLFVNHEDLFPGRVVRAERTVRDIELGVSGVLLSVDASPGNFGSLEADGVDGNLALSWNTRFGRMESKLAATWNHSFSTTIVSGLEPQERVGSASDLGTIPRWRAVANVDFQHGALGLFSALRFTSGYDDAFLGTKNGRSISASLQLDARVSIQLDSLVPSHSILNGIKLAAGAINLFDEAPHYSEVFADMGYDMTQASLRQRFWYLTIKKEF